MPQALTTDDIWAELRRRRVTAKDVARVLGVAHTTVARAINGVTRTPDPRILIYIATLLGVEVEQLCPGRGPTDAPKPIKPPARGSISNSPQSRTSDTSREAA